MAAGRADRRSPAPGCPPDRGGVRSTLRASVASSLGAELDSGAGLGGALLRRADAAREIQGKP